MNIREFCDYCFICKTLFKSIESNSEKIRLSSAYTMAVKMEIPLKELVEFTN